MHFSITQKNYVVDLRLYGYTYHWKYLINRLKINMLLKNINRNANLFFFLTRVVLLKILIVAFPELEHSHVKSIKSAGW